jgi:hypothetical protein
MTNGRKRNTSTKSRFENEAGEAGYSALGWVALDDMLVAED